MRQSRVDYCSVDSVGEYSNCFSRNSKGLQSNAYNIMHIKQQAGSILFTLLFAVSDSHTDLNYFCHLLKKNCVHSSEIAGMVYEVGKLKCWNTKWLTV